MAMRLMSPSTPPPLFPIPGPKAPASVSASSSSNSSVRLRRARAASAAAGAAAAGGSDRDGGRFEGEAMSGAVDRGLTEIARKVPPFEPAADGELAAAAGERLLPINLELWLYRVKVHTRKFEFPEAEKLLDKTDVRMWHWGSCTASSQGMTKLERCTKGDAKQRKAKTHTFGSAGQS